MNKVSDDDLVTLNTYEDPIAASIIKGVLDANGIPNMLSNQALANIFPMSNSLINDVRILVFRKDYNRAKEVIRENQEAISRDIPE